MSPKTVDIPIQTPQKKEKHNLESIFHYLHLECRKLLHPPVCGIVIVLKNSPFILQIRHNDVRLIDQSEKSLDDYWFSLTQLTLLKNGNQLNKSLWPTFIEKIKAFSDPLQQNKVDIYEEIIWPNTTEQTPPPLKPKELSREETHLIYAGIEFSQYYDIVQHYKDQNSGNATLKNQLTIKNLLKHSSNPFTTSITKNTIINHLPNLPFSQPDHHKNLIFWLFSFIKTFNRFLFNVDISKNNTDTMTHFITKHEKIIFDDLKLSKLRHIPDKTLENDIINSYHSKLTTYMNNINPDEHIKFLSDLYISLPEEGVLKSFNFKKITLTVLNKKSLSSKDLKQLRMVIAHHLFEIQLPYIQLTPKALYLFLVSETALITEKKETISKLSILDLKKQFIEDSENLHRIFFSVLGFLTRLVLMTELTQHKCRKDLYQFNTILTDTTPICTSKAINTLEEWTDTYSFLNPHIMQLTTLSNCLIQPGLILESLSLTQKYITEDIIEKKYIQNVLKLATSYKLNHSLDTLICLGMLHLCLEITKVPQITKLITNQIIEILKNNTKTQSMPLDLVKILCKQSSSELKLHIKNSESNLFTFLINNGKYCIHMITKNQSLHYETSQSGLNINENTELPL